MMRTAAATLLLTLAWAVPAQAYRLEHTRWYSHTITYFNTVPRYNPAAKAAAAAWNRSGAHIRFKAVSRKRARVLIVTGTHIPGAGQARFRSLRGIVRRARITVLPNVAKDEQTPVAKLAVETATIAHEMGHVLGLDHEQRRCTTMNAALWEKCKRPPVSWQFHCRTLEADDIRGAIRIYGGRLRKPLPPLYCDQAAAPAPPAGFTAVLQTNGLAHLAWTMPPAPAAQWVVVLRELNTCPTAADDAAATVLQRIPATPGAPLTLDDDPQPQGHYCYAVATLGDLQRPSAVVTVPYDTPAGTPPTPAFDGTVKGLAVAFVDQSTDPDGHIVAWSWDFGDGTTSTEQNPTHTYAAAGTYQVTLLVTDDGRNTRGLVRPVTVRP
jgi:hypothetical protein